MTGKDAHVTKAEAQRVIQCKVVSVLLSVAKCVCQKRTRNVVEHDITRQLRSVRQVKLDHLLLVLRFKHHRGAKVGGKKTGRVDNEPLAPSSVVLAVQLGERAIDDDLSTAILGLAHDNRDATLRVVEDDLTLRTEHVALLELRNSLTLVQASVDTSCH